MPDHDFTPTPTMTLSAAEEILELLAPIAETEALLSNPTALRSSMPTGAPDFMPDGFWEEFSRLAVARLPTLRRRQAEFLQMGVPAELVGPLRALVTSEEHRQTRKLLIELRQEMEQHGRTWSYEVAQDAHRASL